MLDVVIDVVGEVDDVAEVDEEMDDVGEVPVLVHPTRVDWIEMSSYQNVLASPPYDSQPK